MQVLVVSDSDDESSIISNGMKHAGLTCSTTTNSMSVIKHWSRSPHDLVVWAMLRGEASSFVEEFRVVAIVPVVIITRQFDEECWAKLWDRGADAILARPYSHRLLISQTRAILRRVNTTPLFGITELEVAGVRLDMKRKMVQGKDGARISLTPLESKLLYSLMIHKGQILTREMLVEQIWGDSGGTELIRGLVSRLRAKMDGKTSNHEIIKSVRGIGYMIEESS